MTKRKFRTLDDVEADYFRSNPDEVDAYIDEIFEEYAQTADSTALLTSLRTIAKVRGITELAEQIGITRQGLQKALSGKGNPVLKISMPLVIN